MILSWCFQVIPRYLHGVMCASMVVRPDLIVFRCSIAFSWSHGASMVIP